MPTKALGRGLAALISEKTRTAGAQFLNMEYIDAAQVKTNVNQPRENFAQDGLNELAASIKEKGILQPLIVRRTKTGYELIAGERRLRAAKMLKMTQVPAIIKDADNKDSLVLSIVENVQRQQLNPIEEAHAFKQLTSKFGFSQADIAKAVGKDRSSIANTIRLLNLPKEIQGQVTENKISMGHARALLSLADTKDQMVFFEKIIRNSLSVRELEGLIQQSPKRKRGARLILSRREPHLTAVQEQLQHKLGSKVRINTTKKNKGTIVIEFYNLEDLERIIGLLKRS